MKILIVEDDYLAVEGLKEDVRRSLPDSEFREIATESEFCAELEQIRSNPPDAIIMDMMIRWADASPESPEAPPMVADSGPWRAGRRCLDRLREADIHSPVVIYSVLDDEDLKGELPENVLLIPKSANAEEIVKWLRDQIRK